MKVISILNIYSQILNEQHVCDMYISMWWRMIYIKTAPTFCFKRNGSRETFLKEVSRWKWHKILKPFWQTQNNHLYLLSKMQVMLYSQNIFALYLQNITPSIARSKNLNYLLREEMDSRFNTFWIKVEKKSLIIKYCYMNTW